MSTPISFSPSSNPRATDRAALHELRLKNVESKLAENLSNFRAIDSLLQEAFTGLQRNTRRANRALGTHAPCISESLSESLAVLTQLEETLPVIHAQVTDIGSLYDSGRSKAQELEKDLVWLNTDFYERWRAIIFTSSAPVSSQWKFIFRVIFALSVVASVFSAWIVLAGALRAHRHSLVWGERLMS